jgi:predicted PurR-regulated permease PerM
VRERFENLRLPQPVKESVQQFLNNPQQTIFPSVYNRIRNVPTILFSSLGTIFIYLVILPLITFSLMMEMNLLRGRLLMLVPPLYRRDVTEMGQEINEVLGRYVRGQLIVCSTFGFCAPCSSSFWLFGTTWITP